MRVLALSYEYMRKEAKMRYQGKGGQRAVRLRYQGQVRSVDTFAPRS